MSAKPRKSQFREEDDELPSEEVNPTRETAKQALLDVEALGAERYQELQHIGDGWHKDGTWRVPGVYIGYEAGFYQEANYAHFKEKKATDWKWLMSVIGNGFGFDVDEVGEEHFGDINYLLASIPQEDWDQFKDDVQSAENGVIDEDEEWKIRAKEEERYVREDLLPDIKRELSAKPEFQDSYAQFLISHVTDKMLWGWMQKLEIYPEEEGGGSVYVKSENISSEIDLDTVREELGDTMPKRWLMQKEASWRQDQGDWFLEALHAAVAKDQDAHQKYIQMEPEDLFTFFLSLVPDANFGMDGAPKWQSVPGTPDAGEVVLDRWVVAKKLDRSYTMNPNSWQPTSERTLKELAEGCLEHLKLWSRPEGEGQQQLKYEGRAEQAVARLLEHDGLDLPPEEELYRTGAEFKRAAINTAHKYVVRWKHPSGAYYYAIPRRSPDGSLGFNHVTGWIWKVDDAAVLGFDRREDAMQLRQLILKSHTNKNPKDISVIAALPPVLEAVLVVDSGASPDTVNFKDYLMQMRRKYVIACSPLGRDTITLWFSGYGDPNALGSWVIDVQNAKRYDTQEEVAQILKSFTTGVADLVRVDRAPEIEMEPLAAPSVEEARKPKPQDLPADEKIDYANYVKTGGYDIGHDIFDDGQVRILIPDSPTTWEKYMGGRCSRDWRSFKEAGEVYIVIPVDEEPWAFREWYSSPLDEIDVVGRNYSGDKLENNLSKLPGGEAVRRFMIGYYKKKLPEDFNKYIRFVVQLGGPTAVKGYIKRIKPGQIPGFDFAVGLGAARWGDFKLASKYLMEPANLMDKKGMWVPLGTDWNDLTGMFGDDRNHDWAKAAETLFGGGAHEWFDNMPDPELRDVIDYLQPKHYSTVREALVNRTIWFPDEDRAVVMTRKLLDDYSDSDIRDWIENCNEHDFHGQLEEIRDAIVRAGADRSAQEDAHYVGYIKALTDVTGPYKFIKVGGKDMMCFFILWSELQDRLQKYSENSDDEFSGSVSDLVRDYSEKAMPNDEYWGRINKENMAEWLDYHLGELSPGEEPVDPAQTVLPLQEPLTKKRRVKESLLQEGYKYATVQINLPPELADFIVDWGYVNVPDEWLYSPEGDDTMGRERESHITVKYGLVSNDVPDELRSIVDSTKPFPVYFDKISLFDTNPDYDVIKIDIKSPGLMLLNQKISAQLENEDKHPDYHPHVTVAYVKKHAADKLVGENPFASGDVKPEFTVMAIQFKGATENETDPTARTKETIMFNRVKEPEPVLLGEAEQPENPDAIDPKTYIQTLPVYYVVKLKLKPEYALREAFADMLGKQYYSGELAEIVPFPVRMTYKQAKYAVDRMNSKLPIFDAEILTAEDQSQMFWQAKRWPEDFSEAAVKQCGGTTMPVIESQKYLLVLQQPDGLRFYSETGVWVEAPEQAVKYTKEAGEALLEELTAMGRADVSLMEAPTTPDPYGSLPFPADSTRVGAFLRAKRQVRPVL